MASIKTTQIDSTRTLTKMPAGTLVVDAGGEAFTKLDSGLWGSTYYEDGQARIIRLPAFRIEVQS